ncbi:histidine kinase [Kribbella sp. NPDC026611]|uniref:sensor histidine kinase n=1 Tax=Kribbella sp. NPDC026611 TaxID=3154911 RepID=UPI00340F621C
MTRRQSRLRTALTAACLSVPAIFTISGYGGGGGHRGNPVIVVLLLALLWLLHARHATAELTGQRPRGWPISLLLLAIVVYLPQLWWGQNWATAQWFLMASAVLLLHRLLAVAIVAAATLLTVVVSVTHPAPAMEISTTGQRVYLAVFWLAWLPIGALALYCSAALERVLRELVTSRTELAESEVTRERLRLSRDLHDLLGQSLSAISLKGDLALTLLDRDPQAARTEVAELTDIARHTLHGLREVTHGSHTVELVAECDGAAALLGAAGIDLHLTLPDGQLPSPTQELFGWAVREGITNILRHSDARTASVVIDQGPDGHRLEIVNDGAHPAAYEPSGSGLAGLRERARLLAGTLTITHLGDRFRLAIDIPDSLS